VGKKTERHFEYQKRLGILQVEIKYFKMKEAGRRWKK